MIYVLSVGGEGLLIRIRRIRDVKKGRYWMTHIVLADSRGELMRYRSWNFAYGHNFRMIFYPDPSWEGGWYALASR